MKKFRPLPQLLRERFLGDWCSTEAATFVTFHPRVRVAISAQGLFVARSVGCRRLCEDAAAEDVWPISGQFFAEHHVTARSHPSYRHENPRVRTPALRSLQKPFRTSEVKPHRVRRFAARAWLLVS